MDLAKRGATAIESGDFAAAINHYTDALKQLPHAVDYYIKRSTAYTRLSPPEHQKALDDSETAVLLAVKRAKRELIAAAQLRRAIALFGLQLYADSKQALAWVRKLNDKEKSLAIWDMKIANKLKEIPEDDERLKATIEEVPKKDLPSADPTKPEKKSTSPEPTTASNGTASTSAPAPVGVQTPASSIRHEWYQQNETVIVTLFAKGIPKDKATVDIKASSLSISFPLPTGSDYDLSLDPLFAEIDPAQSSYKIMSTKAEFNLKKVTAGQKWHSLEGTGPISTDETKDTDEGVKRAILADRQKADGPSYPTSSKTGPKDWDKLASDLTSKKPKGNGEGDEDEYDGEEGDPVNKFFSTLYKDADPDTRRAMMKSYQESNGTALSTNWAEVKKGEVETSPPDGMEAKKW